MMIRKFTINVDGILIEASIGVPFSNVIHVELHDQQRIILATGYKSCFLGISDNPLERIVSQGDEDVLDVIKLHTGKTGKVVSDSNTAYTTDEVEKQQRFYESLKKTNKKQKQKVLNPTTITATQLSIW